MSPTGETKLVQVDVKLTISIIPNPIPNRSSFDSTLHTAVDWTYNWVECFQTNKGGKFLKKLWCCVGGSITRQFGFIKLTGLIMWIGKHLNVVKPPDLVFLIAVFMHKFHYRRLPSVFDTFFIQVNKKHNYNTRSASSLSYILPKVRTNYWIFNSRFKGPKVWNSIQSDNLKTLSISNFKESLKYDLLKDY